MYLFRRLFYVLKKYRGICFIRVVIKILGLLMFRVRLLKWFWILWLRWLRFCFYLIVFVESILDIDNIYLS